LLKHETAGDPMTGLKWTRKTTEKIANELATGGVRVSANTVGRILKNLKFLLRVNHKKLSSGSKDTQDERNEQFVYISELKEKFAHAGHPVVSVDTKKKELVGNFKNAGAAWNKEPVLVKDHDFRSEAKGMAVPYSLYDVQANRGSVFVGISSDTAEFAVDSIEKWWSSEGRRSYPNADKLLILADGGGSNGVKNKAWKVNLQKKICDRHKISVTVCHYPTGASKWNPVEHRLLSEITKNWAGRPLDSYETVVNYIRTTKTTTGLEVNACLVEKTYQTGIKIPDKEMNALALHRHNTQPKRNYTLCPR
jgi:Rhodopirellula transposase DDE domain